MEVLCKIRGAAVVIKGTYVFIVYEGGFSVDGYINYLDISIQKAPYKLITSIYIKPTFTESIIPYTSNHLTQHKYAAVKFLYNRLNSYGLQEQEYKQELNVIHNILHNNSFPVTPQKQIPNNTA